MSLKKAKLKYIVPPYRYLTIVADMDMREAFVRGEVDLPELWHSKLFSIEKLIRRLRLIKADLKATDDPELKAYYHRRLAQTQFLCDVYKLKHATGRQVPGLLKKVRHQSKALYGSPDKKLTESIVGAIHQAAAKGDAEKKELWGYIAQHVSKRLTGVTVDRPPKEVFRTYREYFMHYAPWVYATKDELPQEALPFVRLALKRIGATKLGWRAEIEPKRSFAHVVPTAKLVMVGEFYKPTGWKGLRRTVVHEVYGHVNRSLTHRRFSLAESEGFAVLIEQLLRPVYSMQRSYRYLAIAAAWGTLGRPMNFREVYEILWRAMRIVGGHPERDAKLKAYNECARAFRVGRADLPGAVFTKDLAYFEGNIKAWHYLASNQFTYNEFVDMLEGRKKAGVDG